MTYLKACVSWKDQLNQEVGTNGKVTGFIQDISQHPLRLLFYNTKWHFLVAQEKKTMHLQMPLAEKQKIQTWELGDQNVYCKSENIRGEFNSRYSQVCHF